MPENHIQMKADTNPDYHHDINNGAKLHMRPDPIFKVKLHKARYIFYVILKHDMKSMYNVRSL